MSTSTLCWHCSDPIGPLDELGPCEVLEHLECCLEAVLTEPEHLHRERERA